MPKMKSHSGTKKRFRVTGTGKLMHSRSNRRHLLTKKDQARKRALRADAAVSPSDLRRVRRLITGM
jgi:large subunit ribosomal protein L35